MTESGLTSPPVLLSGYAARRCAVRTWNEHDPTITAPPRQPDAELQALLELGNRYEADVLAALRASMTRPGEMVDLTGSADLIAATEAAMVAGAQIIVGGQLPNDVKGGRTGKPDILVRSPQRSVKGERQWGYWPGDIKAHKVTRQAPLRPGTCQIGPLTADAGTTFRYRAHEGDLLQVAHYRRMLQAAGWAAPDDRWAVLIGPDTATLPGGPVHGIWVDLDQPAIRTFSRSADNGYANRSPQERYDHEFAFRQLLAQQARHRTDAETLSPVIEPIWQGECATCPWQPVCAAAVGPDDASVALGDRLDRREWRTLRRHGIRSLDDLAELKPEEWISDHNSYLEETRHRQGAASRFAAAIKQAGLLKKGVILARKLGSSLDVPSADVEIDLDAEWDDNEQLYLWGATVSIGGDRIETYFADFTVPAAGEELTGPTVAMWNWLTSLIKEHREAGRSVRVFHYNDPEPRMLRRFAADTGLINLDDVERIVGADFCDLYRIVRDNFEGPRGLSLKVVAPALAGFRWDDNDPGGRNSQLWLTELHASDPTSAKHRELATRIIRYNLDDTHATLELRRALTCAPQEVPDKRLSPHPGSEGRA